MLTTPRVATSKYNLALLRRQRNVTDIARKLFGEREQIYITAYGPDHSKQIYASVYGPDHRSTLACTDLTTSINIALRSSTKNVKQPSLSLTRRASGNAQSTLPSAGTLSLNVKTLRSPTSKSSTTGVAPRCSPTFLRHHVPHQKFIAFRDHILGHRSAFVADDDE